MSEKFLVCPHCQSHYRIDVERLQTLPLKVRCARCSEVFDRPSLGDLMPLDDSPSPGIFDAAVRKVLLVDDSKFFRGMLADVLRPLRTDCLQAASAEEALPILFREKPQLLILDLNLPGMSGMELLRLARANPDLAHLKIIILSSQTNLLATMPVGGAAADLVMSKSFKPEQLLAQARRLLGGAV